MPRRKLCGSRQLSDSSAGTTLPAAQSRGNSGSLRWKRPFQPTNNRLDISLRRMRNGWADCGDQESVARRFPDRCNRVFRELSSRSATVPLVIVPQCLLDKMAEVSPCLPRPVAIGGDHVSGNSHCELVPGGRYCGFARWSPTSCDDSALGRWILAARAVLRFGRRRPAFSGGSRFPST